jgi:hypothetical protein
MSVNLNPDKALIFRIVHVDNVPWIMDHGLHCRNTDCFDKNYVNIGNIDLIDKRKHRAVPIAPGGFLSDYVPFYFTPFSIMLLNITTGRGVPRQSKQDIVIVVSSLPRLQQHKIPFVFTNQHAYPVNAHYFNNLADLRQIDWPLLQARDFRHDPDDPAKKERYQAEALAHQHVPVAALLGIGCFNTQTEQRLQAWLAERGLNLTLTVKPQWYF